MCFLSHNKLSFIYSIKNKYNLNSIIKEISKFFETLPKLSTNQNFWGALALPAPTPL